MTSGTNTAFSPDDFSPDKAVICAPKMAIDKVLVLVLRLLGIRSTYFCLVDFSAIHLYRCNSAQI